MVFYHLLHRHLEYVYDWKKMRRLYSFQLSKFHRKLIMRHKHELFPKISEYGSSSGTSSLSFTFTQTSEQGSAAAADTGTISSTHPTWTPMVTLTICG